LEKTGGVKGEQGERGKRREKMQEWEGEGSGRGMRSGRNRKCGNSSLKGVEWGRGGV